MEYTIHLGEDTLNELDKIVNGGVEVEPLEVTENGEYTAPDGKAYSPVSVNVEGGGGESDFSTAEVNIINTKDSPSDYTFLYVGVSDGNTLIPESAAKTTAQVTPYTVAVSSAIRFQSSLTLEVTGDLALDDVTGDIYVTGENGGNITVNSIK